MCVCGVIPTQPRADNVYFTPGSNVALAGWLVFKNGGLKMYIMVQSALRFVGLAVLIVSFRQDPQ